MVRRELLLSTKPQWQPPSVENCVTPMQRESEVLSGCSYSSLTLTKLGKLCPIVMSPFTWNEKSPGCFTKCYTNFKLSSPSLKSAERRAIAPLVSTGDKI